METEGGRVYLHSREPVRELRPTKALLRPANTMPSAYGGVTPPVGPMARAEVGMPPLGGAKGSVRNDDAVVDAKKILRPACCGPDANMGKGMGAGQGADEEGGQKHVGRQGVGEAAPAGQ